MKKIYLLICLTLISAFAFSQWTLIGTQSANYCLTSVYFTDANTGYVAGQSGILAKTSDGGLTWKLLASGTDNNLNSVKFTDVSTGYAVGGSSSGILIKTINAGTTWSILKYGSPDLPYVLKSIYFTNANIGYAAGEHSTIIKINDEGTILINLSIIGNYDLNSVYFTDTNTGYVVGQEGTIIKIINAGNDLLGLQSGVTNYLNSVYFTDANTGFAVGEKGTIIKTSDAGNTWSVLSSGVTYNLNSVYFIDVNNGFVVGDYGIILKTENGGASWTPQTYNYGLSSVFFTDANNGCAVGCAILKTNNGGGVTSVEETKLSESTYSFYPNPATDNITITLNDSKENYSIEIMNTIGQIIFSKKINAVSTEQIDLSGQPAGVYFVKLLSADNTVVRKIIKE